jgi:hypothetical protein
MFGPWMSASSSPTLAPVWASATARLTAQVDLPTPPLPAPTAITFLTPGSWIVPRLPPAVVRTCEVIVQLTFSTPGMAPTSCWAWVRNWSFTGQAGVVSSNWNDTTPS